MFDEQVACADMIVLNKCDRLAGTSLARAEHEIASRARPAVKVVHATHGAVDPRMLLGLDAGAEDDLASRRSHIDAEGAHDHDDFASFTVDLPPLDAADQLMARIRDVAAAHDVLRVKGFAAVTGKPMRLAVQAVGERVECYFDRPWRDDEPAASRLVVIGLAGLDRGLVEAILRG